MPYRLGENSILFRIRVMDFVPPHMLMNTRLKLILTKGLRGRVQDFLQ